MLRKHNNYSVFIGPCLSSGHNFVNYSGYYSNGPIIQWDEAGVFGGSVWSPHNVNLASGEQYIVTPMVGNNEKIIYKSGIISGGRYLINGEIFIPSSNTGLVGIGVFTSNPNQKIADIRTKGSWQQFNYYGYLNPAESFAITLLSSGHTDSAADWPQPFTGNNTEYALIKNLSILLHSGSTINTGNHFINLIQSVDRIISANFDYNPNRNTFTELGNIDAIDEKNIFFPEGSFSCQYLQTSFANERKMGFNINFTDYITKTGSEFYSSYNVLSNFTGKISRPFDSRFIYPLEGGYRNLYLLVNDGSSDNKDTELSNGLPSLKNAKTISFGNCFLQSYNVRASVGEVPLASVNFGFYNARSDKYNFGMMPNLEIETGCYYSGKTFILPKINTDYTVKAIAPFRINLDIIDKSSSLFNLTGLKISSFDMNVDFNFRDLLAMGYALPKGKDLIFPMYVSLNCDALVTQTDLFSLKDGINQNRKFDVYLSYNTCDNKILQYVLKGANVDSIQTNYSIGQNQSIRFGISQEIFQQNLFSGFFMSGYLWPNPNGISILTPNNTNYEKSIDFIYRSGNNLLLYGQ